MPERKLSNSTLNRSYARWFLTAELSNSFERLQSLMFCNAIIPGLDELYKDNPEELKKAYARHMQFYNSEATFGAVILGITLSMEEEKAAGEEISGAAITGIKTGLMGPMGGIGDTLIWGTLKPIILGIAISFALQGNALGAFIPFLFPLAIAIIGLKNMKSGYRLGREAVMRLLKDGAMNRIITSTSILGLFMMGALAAAYLNIKTPLVSTDVLQETIDRLLPLVAIFSIYFYFKKKHVNYTVVLLIILGISLVAGYFGWLG